MKTPVATVALAVLAIGCRLDGASQPDTVHVFVADGKAHAFADGTAARVALEAKVAADGAAELACPAAETKTARVPGSSVACAETWIAEGCGRRAGYVVFTEGSARVHGARVFIDGIVRLSSDPTAALHEVWAGYQQVGVVDGYGAPNSCAPTWLERYFTLQLDGQRDLACERREVISIFFPRGAIAEGCGKRATYAGNRLAAVVPITP